MNVCFEMQMDKARLVDHWFSIRYIVVLQTTMFVSIISCCFFFPGFNTTWKDCRQKAVLWSTQERQSLGRTLCSAKANVGSSAGTF